VPRLEKEYAYNIGYIFLKLSYYCNEIQQQRKRSTKTRREHAENGNPHDRRLIFSLPQRVRLRQLKDQKARSDDGDR